MSTGIILLHGILRTSRSMGALEKFLNQNGYRTCNIHYLSTTLNIQQIAHSITPEIKRFANQSGIEKFSFVGYSMGGLVIRAYLKQAPDKDLVKLKSIVMLGTPNAGSEVADFLQDNPVYKRVFGPAGQQLNTDQTLLSEHLALPSHPLGIIAGNRSLDPISSRIIGEPSDGKVSVKSAGLKTMTDFCVLPVTHTFMPNNRKVWQQTLHFLQNERFKTAEG